ncbi:MAG TPA: lipopolysaccharide biosynthesis protein [bacterium]|nr:lipopolysaccharide biosynthesis protein [bacterium]
MVDIVQPNPRPSPRIRATAMQGMLWLGGQRVAARALDQLFTIFLVRMLLPRDYGLIALAWIVVGFLEMFLEASGGSAIIQRRDVDDEYLSTAFWTSLAVGTGLFAISFVSAPLLGGFLTEPLAGTVLLVLSFRVLVSSTWSTHAALATRRMNYRGLALVDAASVLVGGLTGLGVALAGMGVWSLVAKALAASATGTVGYYLATRWRPSWRFSWAKFKDVWSFSTPLTVSRLFGHLVRNLDNLLIGRFLGSAALGYYALAYTAFRIPLQDVAAPLHQVMLSAFSRVQDDTARLKRGFLVATQHVAIIALPVMVGLALVAPSLVEVVFGAKWLPSAPVIRVLALAGMFQLVTTLWFSGLLAAGRPDLQLRWAALSVVLYLPAFAVGLRWGIVGVAAGYFAATAILVPVQFGFVARVLGVTVGEVLSAVKSSLLGCAVMATAVTLLDRALTGAGAAALAILVLDVALGVGVYSAVMLLTERRVVLALFDMIREATGRRHGHRVDETRPQSAAFTAGSPRYGGFGQDGD